MKLICKYLLQVYFKYLTKLVLFVHHPLIIVVSGSVNKYFTKEEIKKVLVGQGLNVRVSPKNFNTEIGLPLSVLYLPSGYNSYRQWLPIIFKATVAIWRKNFPKFLVLELGTSDPGDMKYLLSIIKPNIAIITDITQRYLESFSDMNELIHEYEKLVKKIPTTGLLIFNYDNNRIKSLANLASCQAVSFGFSPAAEWQIKNIEKNITGQNFTISHLQIENAYQINRFGQHHLYAFIVGIIIKEYALQL